MFRPSRHVFGRIRMNRRAMAAAMSMFLAACGSVAPGTSAQQVPLSGTPNGVAVRDADGAVFVTDDKSNGIVMTSDIGGGDFSLYARIPAAEGERTGLSQIAFAPNGHLLVERFGFGAASAVFDVAPSGQVALASDTNAARRRLGLLVLDGGTFLSSWFVKEGDAPARGGVSVITRGTAPRQVIERDIVTGLAKPVGLAAVADALYISDQAANRIYQVDLQAARAASAPVPASDVFATVDAPDLLAASPDGTLYTKCGAHAVCSISKRGRPAVIADGIGAPRGVAVDVARKRLIVVDRASASDKAGALRVVPLR
ncbi:NHL repeat containing protein (plasmid) [Burkholderia sp. YI23]|nr:NHL repeat containing protein [Burkholderia sp. YI23]